MPFMPSRRSVMRLCGGAAAAFAMRTPASSAAWDSSATDAIREDAVNDFTGLGYAQLPALSLITGDAFNGGIRYDETRPDDPTGAWLSVQHAARVDDIAERDRPGVLAAFTLLGLGVSHGRHQGVVLEHILHFLTARRRLDPSLIVYVSTELFRPYRDRYEIARVGGFIERPLAEAKAAGDGSGYFRPDGHPLHPGFPTAGIYYPLPGAEPAASPALPLHGYLEIGEVSTQPLAVDAPEPEAGGLGLERLAMVEGWPSPSFEDSRLSLLAALQEEAAVDGKALPSAYASFAAV
jgi:hypothetical protein